MSNPTKEKILADISDLIDSTEIALNEWAGDGNLQFPVLLGMIAVKNNWDEKQVRRADPFVREYVRNHPEWYVTRGAHGGIMKTADKQKKDASKLAKELTKKQLQDAIEAKLLSESTSKATDSSVDSDEDEDSLN